MLTGLGKAPLKTTGERKGRESCLALHLGRLLLRRGIPLPGGPQMQCAACALVPLVLVSALPEALQRYLVLIYPGLVGAVTMVSCSILALTHLLFEFKGKCCFLEGNPQGRKMPRRSGQRSYHTRMGKFPMGEEELKPSPAASPLQLLLSLAFKVLV